MLKQKMLSKLDKYGESVVVFNKRLSDYVVKEYDIGDNRSDSEDSFDEEDFRFKEKERAYMDKELFDYNKKQVFGALANAFAQNQGN